MTAAALNLAPSPPRSRKSLRLKELQSLKLKAHLRRTGARNIEALWRAVGEICDLFDPEQCWNFFKAARYGAD